MSTMTLRDTWGVGVVVVDGNPGTAAEFTAEEMELINAEVQEGIDILTSLASANAVALDFVIQTRVVQLLVDPASVYDEDDWLNAAMNELGYTSRTFASNIRNYLGDLATSCDTDQVYVAFFTKYNASYFAFARSSDNYLIVRYPENLLDYGGHKPTGMDVLFAHETGHIGGARDETTEDCLMSANFNPDKVCNKTKTQFGW
jgi:hypothetical protein